MKLVTFDLSGLFRSLVQAMPSKAAGDVALIKIAVQVIRTPK